VIKSRRVRRVGYAWQSALTEHHAMKAYWRRGSIVPHILDLGSTWR